MVGLVGLDSLVNIVFRLWFMIWNVLIVQIFFAPSEMSKVWNYNRFIVFFLYVFWIMNEKIGYHILLAKFFFVCFFSTFNFFLWVWVICSIFCWFCAHSPAPDFHEFQTPNFTHLTTFTDLHTRCVRHDNIQDALLKIFSLVCSVIFNTYVEGNLNILR